MKKNVKITAVFLAVIMLVSIVLFAAEGFDLAPVRAKPQTVDPDSDTRQIAGDISNITGVGAEEILAIKNSGKSWNDVLEELKTGKPDIPIPEPGGAKPENPADRVRNEINILDPMKNGSGGIGNEK